MVLFFLLLRLGFIGESYAEGEATPAPEMPATTQPAAESTAKDFSTSDYEIDYEEEPESGAASEKIPDEEEAPVVKKPSRKKPGAKLNASATGGRASAVQGTQSKNRFAPMLKSETKSVYKKNGKPLDVDTD